MFFLFHKIKIIINWKNQNEKMFVCAYINCTLLIINDNNNNNNNNNVCHIAGIKS